MTAAIAMLIRGIDDTLMEVAPIEPEEIEEFLAKFDDIILKDETPAPSDIVEVHDLGENYKN